MTDISIRTIADIKRAMAIPDILVILDRNDVMAAYLMRDPQAMTRFMQPRTVDKVRSADIIFLRDGQKQYLQLPKAADLETDGSNAFTIINRGRDGGPDQRLRYRLERSGTPGAAVPSRLPEFHPPLDAPAIAAERAEQERAAAAAEIRHAARVAQFEHARCLPPPPADPRHAALVSRTCSAIAAALDDGVSYNDDMNARVTAAVATTEFAVLRQLETIEIRDGHADVSPTARQIIVANELAGHPRGTWRLIADYRGDRTDPFVHGVMSSGAAENAYATHHPPKSGEDIFQTMRSMEIYHLRDRVEKERKATADARALAKRRFSAGQVLRDLRINGDRFSTATINAVEPTTCEISLTLQKRGSPRRWSATLKAALLDSLCPVRLT